MSTPQEVAALANETYREQHGHEDPAYLEGMLRAAHRQAEAVRQVISDVYARYNAANQAEWARYTDAEILASEHLRLRLVGFADRERWASDRMKALGPKIPLGRFTLHDVGDGDSVCWRPTFEIYTLERNPSAEDEQATAEGIRELGRLWAFGRRLIKVSLMCPDLSEIGWSCWIEYEPATEQGRVMVKDSRYGDAEQLIYGGVDELVKVAVDHVETLKGRWKSYDD